jgi:hypothetical protein
MRSATLKRLGRDREYLAWLHTLPCAVFRVDRLFSRCSGRIHAHHAGERGLSQRPADSTAIPLCEAHHQHGPHAVQVLGKGFWTFHGLDKLELIGELNAQYENMVYGRER